MTGEGRAGESVGVVLRHEGGRVVVDCEGRSVCCTIRSRLQRDPELGKKGVAPGDRVRVTMEGDEGVVTEVFQRKRKLSRPAPGRGRKEQVLVANLDSLLIVAAVKRPALVLGLVDRFLAAAERHDLAAAVAFHKVDLDEERGFRAASAVYLQAGYATLETSVRTGEGIAALREWLKGRTTAFVGHSGAGKSSLANALDVSVSLETGAVHGTTGLGRHTTTSAHLLRIPSGGYLVDMPGIKEFGLWDVGPRDLSTCFPEIAEAASGCRFSDCLHEHEPKCAVRKSAEEGTIAPWRYASYLRILESLR